MRQPLVISLCDLTGNAVRPWAEAGYECWCVDVQHKVRSIRREGNIRFVYGDARSWTPPAGRQIAFVFGFPPCTHLAVSGNQDWKRKGLRMLTDSLDLFNACYFAASWSGAPFLIENPVGALSTHFDEPNYIFDPCEYALYLDEPMLNAYTKKTCIWTGNGFVMPPVKGIHPYDGSKMHRLPPGENRTNERSETPEGFARAVFEANHTWTMEKAA